MRFWAQVFLVVLALFSFSNVVYAAPKAFVAASLVDFVDAIKIPTRAENVVVVAGGSSVLARQIKAGAPADLFLSANQHWAEFVAGTDDIVPVFGNRLVVVGPADHAPIELAALPQLLRDGVLALADPGHVPAGIYAREAFTHFQMWEKVEARMVAAENVRAAARFVQVGAAKYGVIYASDAKALGLNTVYQFPAESHAPIKYWAVKLPSAVSEYETEIDALLAFIKSDAAHSLLDQFGFQPLF